MKRSLAGAIEGAEADGAAAALAVRTKLMKRPCPAAPVAPAAPPAAAATGLRSLLFAKPRSAAWAPTATSAAATFLPPETTRSATTGATLSSFVTDEPARSVATGTSLSSFLPPEPAARPSCVKPRAAAAAASVWGVPAPPPAAAVATAAASGPDRACDANHAAAIFGNGGGPPRRSIDEEDTSWAAAPSRRGVRAVYADDHELLLRATAAKAQAAEDAALAPSAEDDATLPLYRMLRRGSECVARLDGTWIAVRVVSTVHAGHENARYRVVPIAHGDAGAAREIGVDQLRRQTATDAARRARGECFLFPQGKCTRGDRCPFWHEAPKERGAAVAGEGGDATARRAADAFLASMEPPPPPHAGSVG